MHPGLRGPGCPPPNLPSLLSLSFSLAIDRPGCDMVDQYSRDIKPAGCLPASASLSPLLLFPFLSRSQPHPGPHPYPYLRGASLHPILPYCGRV